MKVEPSIKWIKSVDSTNNEVRRQIPDLDNMSVIAAHFQTAGRGQRGNTWKSKGGQNLTFSVLMKPGSSGIQAISADNQFIISKIATLTINRFLRENGIGTEIKWPNDIYAGNRKICGMLIENIIADGDVTHSIIGIGLNLNQIDFPSELINPTSAKLLTGNDFNLDLSLGRIMELMSGYISKASIAHEEIDREYIGSLYRYGKLSRFRDLKTGEQFEGRIKGISAIGELIVEMPDNKLNTYSFKEIGYIL